jgi:hypothetical protein
MRGERGNPWQVSGGVGLIEHVYPITLIEVLVCAVDGCMVEGLADLMLLTGVESAIGNCSY